MGLIGRGLSGSVAKVLMFALVSSLLAVGSLIAVFFTGYFASSVSSVLVRDVLYAQLMGTGLLGRPAVGGGGRVALGMYPADAGPD